MTSEYVIMGSEEDAESYEKLKGNWIVACINQHFGWPERKSTVKFRGHDILIIPEKDKVYPGVALLLKPGMNETDARTLILQFLSSLSWTKSSGIEVASWTGGSRPNCMGRAHFPVRAMKFRITYLPDPQDKDARLALAFYREALTLDHVGYSFLSYYKIVNLRYRKGERQKAWINRTLDKINDHNAKKRIEELKSEKIDVADYLYNSCRCAVAHAGVNPTVDPENLEDINRLRADLPLIRNLSELLIEEHYEIKRPGRIWNEHLYELDGFKSIFGNEVVQVIREGNFDLLPPDINICDSISVRLWGEKKFNALENMTPVGFINMNGIFSLESNSENNLVGIIFGFDFENERLVFNPLHGISFSDDGSSLAAEYSADVYDFLRKYYGNGSLEIWDPQQNICLGRCDPFIPVNIDSGRTFENFEKAMNQALKLAEERRSEHK